MAGMTNRWMLGAIAVMTAVSLSACADARKSLIQEKKAPDEFAVYSRAPLTVPPQFSLRPPSPGAPRTGGKDPTGLAYQAVTGQAPVENARTTAMSFTGTTGELALLRAANALDTDPLIRETVNKETSVLAEETLTVTERLLFSQKASATLGSVIDPEKEARRLKENQALGKDLNEGKVPTIRRKKMGLLEGLIK